MSKRKASRKSKPASGITVNKVSLTDVHDLLFQFFQHLNRVTLEQEKIAAELVLLTNSAIRRDNQLDRMIAIQRLGLKRLERFLITKVEPDIVASIRRDLKTPTLHPLDRASDRNHQPAMENQKC
jgi:hypothetical protein